MTSLVSQTRSAVSTFFHSIRFRLALWFGLVLAVILLVFSVFVYYRQSQDAYNQAASRLAVRFAELDSAFARSFRTYGEGAWLNVPGTSASSAFHLKEGEVIVLTDPSGQVGAFSGPVNRFDAEALADIARNQAPNSRLSIYHLKPGQGSEPSTYLFRSAPVIYNNDVVGWVTLGQQLDPDNFLGRLRVTLFFSTTAMLIAVLLGAYWLADQVLRPVKTITRTAQEISETDLNRRLNIDSRDELGELAHTFDQMLDRLQAAFDRQRQFTADASHELRTPLTVIGLEASRALGSNRTVDDYRQALGVIQSENQSMTRLVEELLVLARMDADKVHLKMETLDLSDAALEVLERYEPLAEQKGLRLQAADLPEILVHGDQQFLLQMVGNLVDNAIKYTAPGTPEPIIIETGLSSPAGAGPAAFVRVTDHGPGISPEHIPHLFERFYRADAARSHNQDDPSGNGEIPGSGLGLAIVQRIAQLHCGQVNVISQPGQGSTFEVFLPLHTD